MYTAVATLLPAIVGFVLQSSNGLIYWSIAHLCSHALSVPTLVALYLHVHQGHTLPNGGRAFK